MRYIGGKTKILPFLDKIISDKVKNALTFCDLFSGTGCVGRFFKNKYKIISNDLMYFSYLINFASIELNEAPEFKSLGFNPIDYMNDRFKAMSEKSFGGLFEREYSEVSGRLYFSLSNARRIDFARCQIDNWKKENKLENREYLYLAACLVESIPFVSNISGTYGAYNKFWDKRAEKDFFVRKIDVFDNKQKNKCFNRNANELIREIDGDILYLDPPYNTRQYISNYHILETLARWDAPEIVGKTGLRKDRNELKSEYCKKKRASKVLADLIENAQFNYILLSYNTEGIIPVDIIEDIFSGYKNYKKFEIPYKTYKSNSKTGDRELKELIFYAEKQ